MKIIPAFHGVTLEVIDNCLHITQTANYTSNTIQVPLAFFDPFVDLCCEEVRDYAGPPSESIPPEELLP